MFGVKLYQRRLILISIGENMNRNFIVITIAVVLAATMALAEDTRPQKNTDETIAYLLAFVAKSDCTFIRNGQSYTGKQASYHMKTKRQYFKDKITTPEDFIRLAATKSIQTGEPYLVRTKEGKELRCDEWMKQVLEEYRKTKKDNEEK
jgi:FPC/CPF motif-containing protein YcgG